jgi:hypothetical protein
MSAAIVPGGCHSASKDARERVWLNPGYRPGLKLNRLKKPDR